MERPPQIPAQHARFRHHQVFQQIRKVSLQLKQIALISLLISWPLLASAQSTPTEPTEALQLHAKLALLLLLIPLLLWLDQPHALVPLVSTGWPLLLLVVLLPLLFVRRALRILPQPLVLLPKVLAVATLAIGETPRQAMTATQLQRKNARLALLIATVYNSQLPIPITPMQFACALPANMLNLD